MPLKHATETFLVFLLGLVIAITGIIASFLPTLPGGIVTWGVFFVLSLLYPLALYPLFKKRRADYALRLLHFVPAAILIVWLAIDLVSKLSLNLYVLPRAYTWAWTMPAVFFGFTLLTVYCFQVIRQRRQRTWALAAVLVPFILLAALDQNTGMPSRAAYRGVYAVASVFGLEDDFGRLVNLSFSNDRSEEALRIHLRRMDRRAKRLAARSSAGALPSSASVSTSTTSSVLIGSSASGQSSSAPPVLTDTGLGFGTFSLFFLAGYCAVLQKRAKKRMA